MRISGVCFSVLGLVLAACGGGAPSDGTQLANGKYTADALNVESTITATVTIKGHKISNVTVKDNGNTYAQYTSPYTVVAKSIVDAQSTDVDGITGATYSSDAVKKAVDLALAQARGEKAVPAKNAALAFTPGTYTGSGKGYGGQVQARVTFSETGITDIRVGQQRETAHVGDVALQTLPAKIIAANGLNVDAVSGATMSSFGLKEAVLNAADQAGVTNRKAFIDNTVKIQASAPIEDTWDVVVIGGGGAGLCAAAQAAQDGSTVLVIEKNAELGGNTLVSGGVYQSVDHSLVWDPFMREMASYSGCMYGATFSSMVPGRNPSSSPDVTTGRVRTSLSYNPESIPAIPSHVAIAVLPVPDGPLTNTMSLELIASTRACCPSVLA